MGANRHMSVESRRRYTPEVAGEVMPGSEGPAGSRSHNLISARRASLMQEPVLVLNATYEPINVTAVRRAMVLMLKGVAQAEEMHNAEVHSAAHAHKVPSVIRLLAYRHIPQQSRALSRKNIWKKDTVFASSHLTSQYHFEDTPREAVRAIALTASLLLRQFWRFMNLDGPFGAGFRKTPQGRLFGRKFRENLIEL